MIGIMGGSFDPVHYGHLRTALDVLQTLNLDQVRFIPVHHPVHREPLAATAEQRLQMLMLATADNPQFQVDDRELRHNGPSYTLHTLRSLQAELTGQPLYLILGSDAWADFAHWHQPASIRQLANIVVMQRPGEIRMNDDISEGIIPVSVTQLDISATTIRQHLTTGQSIQYLLPDAVEQYIKAENLYASR